MEEWRRKYTRMACYIPGRIFYPVFYEFRTGEARNAGWGIIHDISLGGLGFESRTPLRKDQKIFITFAIAENFTFANTQGIVTRVIQKGIYYIYGVKFVELVDQEHLKNALEEYFSHNAGGEQL